MAGIEANLRQSLLLVMPTTLKQTFIIDGSFNFNQSALSGLMKMCAISGGNAIEWVQQTIPFL